MVALFSRRLHRAWEFTPGQPIWRLHPPVNKRIIGEVRDVEARQATFFALDAVTGSCLWRDRELHDAWWVAIERVAGDKLVLHGFSSPDSPVLHGATVVDIPGGTVVWSNREWTGNESELRDAGVDLSAVSIGEDTLFPIPCDPHGQEKAGYAFLSRWPINELAGALDFAGCGRYTIVAAHIKTGSGDTTGLMHVLRVHDTESGNVVYEDTLAAAAKGLAPDAFFVQGGVLYYLRERKTLCAVKL